VMKRFMCRTFQFVQSSRGKWAISCRDELLANAVQGAVLLWRARNEDELGRVLEDDPFAMHGLIAQTDIQEWVPVFGPWPEIGGTRSSG
jgi:hypothetical protein